MSSRNNASVPRLLAAIVVKSIQLNQFVVFDIKKTRKKKEKCDALVHR